MKRNVALKRKIVPILFLVFCLSLFLAINVYTAERYDCYSCGSIDDCELGITFIGMAYYDCHWDPIEGCVPEIYGCYP